MSATIKLFGTDWCMKSAALRNYMQSKWIEFEDYNVESDAEAATFVRSLYEGELKFPTVVKGDKHIKNPSIKALNDFLEI